MPAIVQYISVCVIQSFASLARLLNVYILFKLTPLKLLHVEIPHGMQISSLEMGLGGVCGRRHSPSFVIFKKNIVDICAFQCL